MSAKGSVTGLNGTTSRNISFISLRTNDFDSDKPVKSFTIELDSGWNMFSIPFDISTIIYGHSSINGILSTDVVASNGEYNFKEFIKNHLYEHMDDTVPYFYKAPLDYALDFVIAKDYLGQSYLPEYDFNALGNYSNYKGYEAKCRKKLYLKLSGKPITNAQNQRTISIDVPTGWYIIPFLNLHKQSVTDYFRSLTENNNLIICKDAKGNTYYPSTNYNGLGNLKPGEAYKIKTE